MFETKRICFESRPLLQSVQRRALVIGAGAWSVLAWIESAFSQQKKPPVVIGWLGTGRASASDQYLSAFKEGMAEYGWKEGVQYVVEVRWAEGYVDRLLALADEIAAKKPVIIVAYPSLAVAAVRKAAPATPVVASSGDPLASGLVKSLARPGGMITGVSNVVTQISVKHLELLMEAVPKLRRVGFLADANSPTRAGLMDAAKQSIAQFKIKAEFADAWRPEDIEPAIAQLAKGGAQALVVMTSNFFPDEREQILRLALAQRWPVVGGGTQYAEAGALLTYGADSLALHRRAAYFVDRILNGAKPGDLPIEQPTKFVLTLNLKTTKALEITMPPTLMIRADRVIK